MSQWIVFGFAWYGLATAIWNVLGWFGIKVARGGWLWKFDLRAGLLDVIVAGASYYAMWYLLRHSLKAFLAGESSHN
jgi:hypothetical protein